ncbi:MAG: hypothetical protein LQ337_008417 [Flavoplaca oasis]|nr:MAG: hypothetical protein LQ337_008417 [Flavoplaca oasis]
MRLLHTERLDFQEFFDSQTPVYAILSHRWTGDEVSFQDFDRCKKNRKPSFDKIRNCCSLAKKNGYEWVWIDTCCIDKKSSAELSEAINSMYAWYENARVCYVYLVDVSWSGDWETTRAEFRSSAWFTRGWTLQELLAPDEVLFFDLHWRFIGHKKVSSDNGRSLNRDISEVTGISGYDLQNEPLFSPTRECVAKKLSWLSRRSTTRVEDMAYCMLGLCSVNMPLLYGEGEKAFLRLQSEIIKQSDDESIFAWFCDEQGRSTSFMSGLIAPSPKCFAESGQVFTGLAMNRKQPYFQTNKGLAYPIPRPRTSVIGDHYSLGLECSIESRDAKLELRFVAFDLVFYGNSWRRLLIGGEPRVLSDFELWNSFTKEEGCFFETIYFPENRIVHFDPNRQEFLNYYQLPEGQIWTGPSGERYEIRDWDWQSKQDCVINGAWSLNAGTKI